MPFLDRIGPPFTSTFRPQEAFSTQMLDAAVRALNRERPQAVFVTGDITDNAQRNELDARARDAARRQASTRTAARRGYDGVQAADSADPFYYRPDHDAPAHPGALAQAQRPFRAAGLDAPWYALVGNHDVLAQGEVPVDAGDRRLRHRRPAGPALDPELVRLVPRDEATAEQAVADLLLGGASALDTIEVPADPERRLSRPARPSSGSAQRDHGRPRPGRARDPGRHRQPRRHGSRGRVTPAQIERAAGAARAGRRPLGRRALAQPAPRGGAARSSTSTRASSPRSPATRTATRSSARGRYWRISTSSLADFPQQSRMFRLRETAGGGVALETWMVDHDGRGLAGISRELAYLDAQGGRPQRFAGARRDRNARLFVRAP